MAVGVKVSLRRGEVYDPCRSRWIFRNTEGSLAQLCSAFICVRRVECTGVTTTRARYELV